MEKHRNSSDTDPLISQGRLEPFSKIKNHIDVPGILRYALMTNRDFAGEGFHVACHVVTPAYYRDPVDFAHPHTHDFDEFNILLPLGAELRYAFELDGEKRELQAPCTVYIPAGTEHNCRPLAGEGIFICIQLDNEKQTADAAALQREFSMIF